MDQRSYNNRPVKVGDVIKLTIDGVGSKGDGFGKIDNFIVMVPNAREGETVKVRITRVLRKMAFGELADNKSETLEKDTKTPASDMEEAMSDEPAIEDETPVEEHSEEN
jgi:predicted RNA-binding protein with TRAM domain